MVSKLIDLISYFPIERIFLIFEKARHRRISRRLGKFGNRVTFSVGFYVEDPKTVFIFDDVSFGPHVSILGVGGCTIGRNTMIATRTLILTTSHDRRSKIMRESAIHKPVIIEDNVWIGAGSILLGGITIGSGAVIGAGAVVTHDIKSNQIVYGVPARSVRDRFSL